MPQSHTMSQKKQSLFTSDTIETLKSTPRSMAKNALQSFGDIGTGIGKDMMDTFLGTNFSETGPVQEGQKVEKPGNFQKKVEFKRLYDFNAEQERQTIKELLTKIQNEIQALKQANSALAEEVKDVEKVTLSSADEKPGVYHIRFLEIVLSFIQNLRAKVSESNTWLQALTSKKAKRGSAFAARSKSSGTQYSMSEEHKVVRNTQ